MKYQVVDAGYKLGKDKNVMFATNDKQEAIIAANESGAGVIVIKNTPEDSNEQIVYISLYQSDIGLPG